MPRKYLHRVAAAAISSAAGVSLLSGVAAPAGATTIVDTQRIDLNVDTYVDCASFGLGDSVLELQESGSVLGVFRHDDSYSYFTGLLTEDITGSWTNVDSGKVVSFGAHFVDRSVSGTFVDAGLFYTLTSGGAPQYLSAGRFIRDYNQPGAPVVFEAGHDPVPQSNLVLACQLV